MKQLVIILLILCTPVFASYELKQSTSVDVRIGPFVDVGDGFTPETAIGNTPTNLTGVDEAEVLKYNGAATSDITTRTWAAVAGADGWYDLTLTAGDTDTLGDLTIVIQDDNVCLPVFATFSVVTANYWDSKYSTDVRNVDVTQWNGTNVAAPATAGYPAVTIKDGTGTGEIDTLSGSIVNVDLVDLTTTTTTATNVTTVSAGGITASSIATDAIGAAEIAANAIGASEIATDAITATEIATDAIGAAEAGFLTDSTAFNGADIATINTNAARLTAARAQAIDDWINGGRLDLILDIIAADTTTDIPATISTMQGNVTDILTDTAVIGAAGVGLTAVALADATSDAVLADAIWNAATVTYGGAGSYGEKVESLSAGGDATEAKQDQIIAAVITNAAGVDIAADIIALKAETATILTDTAAQDTAGEWTTLMGNGSGLTEAGGTGDHLTAIDLPNQTMDITGTITTVTNLTTNNDKTGYSIADATSDAVIADAVHNAATITYGSAGSYGLLLETNLDAPVSGATAPTASAVADQVWNEAIAGHLGAGSTGLALNSAGSAGDPWSTAIPGAYGAGTAGLILGTNLDAILSARTLATADYFVFGSDQVITGSFVASALDDMFSIDSGNTYATAAAGSVVKEIADNAGGSSLTESGIADAVWDELLAGHVIASSAGATLTTAGAASGSGTVVVTDVYGGGDYTYKTGAGAGIDNAVVYAYLKTDYDAGNTGAAFIKAQTTTTTDGGWNTNLNLDPQTYTLYYFKQGSYGPDTVEVTIL